MRFLASPARRLWLFLLLLVLHLPAHVHAQDTPSSLLVLHDAGRALTLLDGRSAAVLATRALPTPLAGEPQIAPDAASVLWGAENGDIQRWTLPELKLEAQAAAPVGPGTPLIALSGDGRWLLAAGARDATAQILDAQLQPVRRIPIASREGRQPSRAAQLLTLREHQSWLLAPDALNELWEISYNPRAEPIFDGLVHDYRMGEAIPQSGFLGVRRTPLAAPMPQWLVPAGTRLAVGAEHCHPPTPCVLRVMHLDARSQIASWQVGATPRTSASAAWTLDGRLVLALAGADAATPLLELPRGQPWRGVALPAAAQRILAQMDDAPLWLQRPDGHWLRLGPRTLQVQAELAATPESRLLPTSAAHWLVVPGAEGSLSLLDAATLAERQRLGFAGLRGAWLIPRAASPQPAGAGPSHRAASP